MAGRRGASSGACRWKSTGTSGRLPGRPGCAGAKGATVTAARHARRATGCGPEVAVRLEAGRVLYHPASPREPDRGAAASQVLEQCHAGARRANRPSAELRFVLPDAVTSVTVHSRGDEMLPDSNERMSWPAVKERDMSRLGNWNRWLGFFRGSRRRAALSRCTTRAMMRAWSESFPSDVAQGRQGLCAGLG